MTDQDKSKKSFWDQPALARALPGTTYTRFVRWMRLILPLLAVALLGLVMAWPSVEETMAPVGDVASAPPGVGRNELLNPRFEGEDESGQPFSVTARRAVQSGADPDIAVLERPMADITMKGGTWLAAEAASGTYRRADGALILQGAVKLFHDQGYEFRTDKLMVNMKTRQAWSDRPVSGRGPAGTLEATGLTADKDSQLLVFTGPARLVLNHTVKGL